MVEKEKAIILAYQIATLSFPTDEVMNILRPLAYERVLELLLVVRQAKDVKSPLNFLRRAISEGWTPETLPQPVNRKVQNIETRFYLNRGATQSEAEAKALENQRKR